MKFHFILIPFLILIAGCSGETFKKTMDSLGKVVTEEQGLTSGEVASGLKEALVVGTNQAVVTSSKQDGFYKNPRLFIPFPQEAEKVKSTALNLGLKSQVDRFEETLNRAAEEAVSHATPIFVNAITSMTVNDAFGILNGGQNAATTYLRGRTENDLRVLFQPEVEKAIEKVELTKYWNPLASAYNTASTFTGGQPVNPDLTAYVTSQAMDGLFLLIAEEEAEIRENPAARASDLLKRVFGSVD